VATQDADVVNVGVADADTGNNDATGNESFNQAFLDQDTDVATDNGGDVTLTIAGPVSAFNSGSATNRSDGTACICTGDAQATGNVAENTINQDLDLSVGLGTIVVTADADIVNVGVGNANSGFNDAVGNDSLNVALGTQTALLGSGNAGVVVIVAPGPFSAFNSAATSNISNGTAKVGAGDATAAGNIADNEVTQTADLDADVVVAAIASGVVNVGAANATTGNNTVDGNNSVNVALLGQLADGFGTVFNSGSAVNESDGTSLIGDFDADDCEIFCCPLPEGPPVVPPVVPPEEPPVTPPGPKGPPVVGQPEAPEAPEIGESLPRTGMELEMEALLAALMLLLGLGLVGESKRRLTRV